MGAVFFLFLAPIILVIFATIVIMGIIGIAVFVIGVSGSIVSARALSNKEIKKTCLYFFVSLLLLGVSCLAVLAGLFSDVDFFVIPMLIIVGGVVIALGIIGIIGAFNIEHKAAKTILIVLLSLSAIIGAIVFAIGALMGVFSIT